MTHSFANPFTTETARIPIHLIVDRHNEISRLLDSVVDRKQNALVVGQNGIGKTSLLRKLRNRVAEERPTVMLVEIEMRSLSRDTTSFLQEVLLRICIETWTRYYRRPYSELHAALGRSDDVWDKVRPHVRHLINLFRIVRPRAMEAKSSHASQFGATNVIAANVTETSERTVNAGDLSAGEFITLASELVEVIRDFGVDQIIVFGDEANHIRLEAEIDLFKRNFEAFAEQNIQFVFTARETLLNTIPDLRTIFSCVTRIAPFPSTAEIRDLIDRYTACPHCQGSPHVHYDDNIVEWMWRATEGHPAQLQRLAGACCERALAARREAVVVEDLLAAVLGGYKD